MNTRGQYFIYWRQLDVSALRGPAPGMGSSLPFHWLDTFYCRTLTGRVRARACVWSLFCSFFSRCYEQTFLFWRIFSFTSASRPNVSSGSKKANLIFKEPKLDKGAGKRAQTWRKKRVSLLQSNHGSSWYAGKLKGGLGGGFEPTNIRVMSLCCSSWNYIDCALT